MHSPSTRPFRGPLSTALFLALVLLGQGAAADGDAAAGQAKAAVCSACHGMDGNSMNPEWPSLAGQHANYIVKQLKAFKSGVRQNPVMATQVVALSDQDMADLAAYFAQQKRARGVADPAFVASGERLYRGGNKDTGVPACIACHGPTGQGNLPGGWPSIAGQKSAYSANQLKAYKSGDRKTDGDGQMMRNVAHPLTDEEITSVTSYVQGLY